MPYEVFWHLNPTKLKPFFNAFKIEQERDDYQRWLQGYYNYAGFSAVISNFSAGMSGKRGGAEYPDKPLTTEQAERKLAEERANDPEYQEKALLSYLDSLAVRNNLKKHEV